MFFLKKIFFFIFYLSVILLYFGVNLCLDFSLSDASNATEG